MNLDHNVTTLLYGYIYSQSYRFRKCMLILRSPILERMFPELLLIGFFYLDLAVYISRPSL